MRVELRRRLHRDQRQQLEQMVRHHVAQRAGLVVKIAAMADAEFLVDRDLDVVDVIAVPDRLEHAVGEAQHQDVLDGLLAEVMIDPVDLVLVHQLQQFAVQRFRRGQIGAERLFNHQPPPCAVFGQHAGAAELPADRQEAGRRRRQIEQPIAAGFSRRLELVEPIAQSIERGRVFRIGLDAGDTCQQAFGDAPHPPSAWRIDAGLWSGCRSVPRSTSPGGRRRRCRNCPAEDCSRRDYRGQGSPAGVRDRR